jgi:hypothetical protein
MIAIETVGVFVQTNSNHQSTSMLVMAHRLSIRNRTIIQVEIITPLKSQNDMSDL